MAETATLGPLGRARTHGGLSLRTLLLIAGPLVLIAVAAWFYLTGGRYVSTDNAYVQADLVPVATDVSGIVKSVEVTDNQHVKAGQVLFRLDDQPFRYAVDNAAAQLASAKGDIEALRADWRAREQEIKLAEVDLDFARREWARRHDLFVQHVAPQSTMDQAQQALDRADRQLAAARQQAASVAAHLANDIDRPAEGFPKVQAAQSQLDIARLNLDHTVVRATSDGVVTNVPSLQTGRYLAASTTAFSLIVDNTTWIEANPKETELTWVRSGQPVRVSVDTYPGVAWACTVASLAPASGSQFALLPAQNTSGNWVKVVQRIPIRIACPASPDRPVLRAGMSAEIEIDTGHRRTVGDLFRAIGL